MTKTSEDILTDRAAPSAGQPPSSPSPEVAAEIMAQRLGARTIYIAGDCDRLLIQALEHRGVEIQVAAGINVRAGSSAASSSGTFDLALCTEALDRMGADEASDVVAQITSVAPRVLVAQWWVDRPDPNADTIDHLLKLFAERGFAPVVDREVLALNAIRFERSDGDVSLSGVSIVGDLIAKLLVREQAFRSLAEDRRSRLARIAADEMKMKSLSAQLQAAEAALRSRDEARRLRWAESLPLGAQLLWARLTNRIPASRRRRLALADDIRATGLFDDAFYRAQNPYVVQIGLDPAVHFALVGWKMDRRPNPFFAPLYYAKQLDGGFRADENPLLHFARSGWKQGMRPSPEFDPAAYLASRPGLLEADVNPLLHYIEEGYPSDPSVSNSENAPAPEAAMRSIPELLGKRRAASAPLPVYFDEKGEPTVTVLLDNVVRGVASDRPLTAIVVGCLVAKRRQAKLRIATLGVALDPSVLGQVLSASAIDHRDGVDFVHIPADGSRSLAITNSDTILTTSWTSTRATLGALPPEQVLYLAQENERNGCACSDDRLLCDETLSDPKLQILVQTRRLLDELVAGDRSGHFATRAQAFEPVALNIAVPKGLAERKPHTFVFHADPHDQRNLYHRGLEAIHVAMCDGTLPSQQWAFHFIGRQLEDVVLPDGVRPIFCERLDWNAYATLIASMDLGLCLGDGPGPSRLVLDLASVGAVVVANDPGHGAFDMSRNILPTTLEIAGICETLRRGVALAGDVKTRSANREADQIRRAWGMELKAALDGLQIGMR